MPEAPADPATAGTTDDAFLGGALMLLQRERGYRAGIDPVLLAAAAPRLAPGARVLDTGAGVGTAGLCLARRVEGIEITLVERAAAFADLARRNAERNGLANRVRVIEADILDVPAWLSAAGLGDGAFDCLLANPPWHLVGSSRMPRDELEAGANAMPVSGLENWLRFLARVAAPDATLVLIHRADALASLLAALDRRFGAVEILPFHSRAGEAASRVIVRARKGSRKPLMLHAGIVVHDAGGAFTPAVDTVLRSVSALPWPRG